MSIYILFQEYMKTEDIKTPGINYYNLLWEIETSIHFDLYDTFSAC